MGVGCALLQRNTSNRLVPIHFGSFRFNEREQKESITFQELLGCVMALKYFDKYIAYSKVILKTDHRPIVHLFSNYYTNSQISRFLTVFEKYDLHVMFTPGRTNLVADYLSRAHTIAFKELNLEKLQEYVDRMSFPDTKPQIQTLQEKIRLKTVQHTNRFTPLNETLTKPPLIQDTEIDTPITWHYNKPVKKNHTNKNRNATEQTTKRQDTQPTLQRDTHSHSPVLIAQNEETTPQENFLTTSTDSNTGSPVLETPENLSIQNEEKTQQTKVTHDISWQEEIDIPTNQLIIEQKSDKNLGAIYDHLKNKRLPENDQKARHVIIESEFYDLHRDVLYRYYTYAKNNSHYKYCLALPQTFEETVIRYFHDKGHFAHWKMMTAIRQRYYFSRMRSKLEYFVKNCEVCQSYKNPRKEHKQFISETLLTEVFTRWNIDLKGPIFHRDNNYRYILVMIENTTRYMELAPLLDCTTNTIMEAFYDTIVLRHGPPKIIAINRASYFRSQQMQTVAKLLNCDFQYFYSHVHISAGKIESNIRLIASQLGKVCKDYPDKWHTIIPAVQQAHNIFPSLATNSSPHFLVYGREMTDHLQRLFDVETELTIPETTQGIVRQINASRDTAIEVLHQNHAEYSSHSSATYNRHLKPDKYELLQPVYLKTVNHDRSRSPALQKRWIGPYYIREFLGKTACRISRTINGEILKTPFHLNLLKPAYIRHIKEDLTPVLNLDNIDPQDIPRLQITTK